jgi:UDP-N-acetylmuramoylalanine--D-glutamate ligase
VKVLVIGSAISGRVALGLLEHQGHETVVYDRDPKSLIGLEGRRETHGGDWHAELLQGVDLVVVSPGVPEHVAPIQDSLAAGLPVWSEMELASRYVDAPLIAITGTNGKTTATDLAAEMLSTSGLRTRALGNIGLPLSDAVGGEWDVLVVEASSFQLRFIDEFHPEVSVLLNLAPDHLDWHGSYDAYVAAKARIWENQDSSDVLIFDADDPGAAQAVADTQVPRVEVSGLRRPHGGSGPDAEKMYFGAASLDLSSMKASDPAFLVDIAAAGEAALAMGASIDAVMEVARDYKPGRHRRQEIGRWDGVLWVNDSKATNPHAAVAAIRSYPSVILIAGGRNKGLDVAAVAREPSVRHVIGIGETGQEIVDAAASGTVAADLAEAVAAADEWAGEGDTVLLSPACASFDMFDSYIERGDVFTAAVRDRKEE